MRQLQRNAQQRVLRLPVRRALVVLPVAAPQLVVLQVAVLLPVVPHRHALPQLVQLAAAPLDAVQQAAVRQVAVVRPTTNPFTGCAPAA